MDVVITIGALMAVVGIVQFGILKFDSLSRRPTGALTHYMTYSGTLMLVACTAAARILFRQQDRLWAALIMPALIVALAATLTRNAWVGACAGIGLLLLMRDFRLVALLLPVVAAVFIAFSPPAVNQRFVQTFWSTDTSDPSAESNRDRLAMIRSGLRMIKDHPLTGVGPDMVRKVYRVSRPGRSQTAQSAPAQRADPDRGGTRHPRAAHLALVRGHADSRLRPQVCLIERSAVAADGRARLRGRHARRRHVRIQFRRLRIPHAVSPAGDAAVRRRPAGRDDPCRPSSARCLTPATEEHGPQKNTEEHRRGLLPVAVGCCNAEGAKQRRIAEGTGLFVARTIRAG